MALRNRILQACKSPSPFFSSPRSRPIPSSTTIHALRPSPNPLLLLARPLTTAPAAAEPPETLTDAERTITRLLQEHLQPTQLQVRDVSGGCGSMYALEVVSERFRGLPIIKQHRLVTGVLRDQIADWHGLQLKTRAPE
jgi:stress-induced morphogen